MKAIMNLHPSNIAILTQHVNAEKVFDMESTLVTLTEDCVFEDVPTGERYVGREAVRKYYNEWWGAFRNVSTGGKRYIPDENTLVVETHFVGQHIGTYRGHEATQRKLNLPLVIVVSFKDGLMSGEKFYYDSATLYQQIGRV
jgi:steroid delta-isomerase-like uncharacterized protein